jgi:hypothetical protein
MALKTKRNNTLHMYGAYLINEYHQDFKSIANFKVLNRMINVMMCYSICPRKYMALKTKRNNTS